MGIRHLLIRVNYYLMYSMKKNDYVEALAWRTFRNNSLLVNGF
jgi:hypothetical protein